MRIGEDLTEVCRKAGPVVGNAGGGITRCRVDKDQPVDGGRRARWVRGATRRISRRIGRLLLHRYLQRPTPHAREHDRLGALRHQPPGPNGDLLHGIAIAVVMLERAIERLSPRIDSEANGDREAWLVVPGECGLERARPAGPMDVEGIMNDKDNRARGEIATSHIEIADQLETEVLDLRLDRHR